MTPLRPIRLTPDGVPITGVEEEILSPEENRKRQEDQIHLQGEQTGWKQMHEVLFEHQIFAGIPMIDIPKDPSLKRHYLLGFWQGVLEQIQNHVKLTRGLSELQRARWDDVAKMVDGRMRDAISALKKGDTAEIEMRDVQDRINEAKVFETEEDAKKKLRKAA